MKNHTVIWAKRQVERLCAARHDAAFQRFLCKALGIRMGVSA